MGYTHKAFSAEANQLKSHREADNVPIKAAAQVSPLICADVRAAVKPNRKMPDDTVKKLIAVFLPPKRPRTRTAAKIDPGTCDWSAFRYCVKLITNTASRLIGVGAECGVD